MPTTETAGLGVVAGDVLALRGTGLAAAETWALLCQAAQALQDLFLSNGGVVGGSRMGPVVTPHTLELTPRGRVTLQLAPPETARAYLPPEYRPGRVYSDTDSEKMWMYSLGRALVDTTPRVAALTGTVSVSPSSALQSVLAAMTEPDPHRRASLMNLLDVISEYCRTRLQSKPFTHIVMDMYREVVRSPQYAARRRAAIQLPRPAIPVPSQQHQQNTRPTQQQQLQSTHFSKHHQTKGALFRAQSRNSRSHPNLLSLSRSGEGTSATTTTAALVDGAKPEFQSQLNIRTTQGTAALQHLPPRQQHRHHARTNSQPEYTDRCRTKSSNNLLMIATTTEAQNSANIYSDPIYALPVKPFLSSQDVRVNGLAAKPMSVHRTDMVYAQPVRRHRRNSSQPDVAHLVQLANNQGIYSAKSTVQKSQSLHQRQYSNPQLPGRTLHDTNTRHSSQPNVASGHQLQIYSGPSSRNDHAAVYGTREATPSYQQQRNPTSSMNVQQGLVPPKPPRIITTLKRTAPASGPDGEPGPPVKPPRSAIKNGPRARRGKAVQRAPSRLYRAIGGPTRSFNKTQCVGPEFVVRANQPVKQLSVGDVKTGTVGRIVVILLTGQRVEVTCDSQKVTAGDLFQAIVQAEDLEENFTMGLAALLAGDFAMLPPDTKLNKVAPPGWLNNGKSKGLLGLPVSFMLYLRLRFFLPSLRGIRSWISKHLLYLQIRRCILEQQLVCPLSQLINLTGLALQAEFGNYNVNEHGCGDYFLLEHYLPESLILNQDQSQQPDNSSEALRAQLHQAHRERRGLDANKAEEMFITHAQTLQDYGSHYYIATIDSKELAKVMIQREKNKGERDVIDRLHLETENIYEIDKLYGKTDSPRLETRGDVLRIPYTDEQKMRLPKSVSINDDIYAVPRKPVKPLKVEANNNSNNKNVNNKVGKSKKTDSNVWLAIHGEGMTIFDRGGGPRERVELASFHWKDIQTLSYSKSCLVVHSRLNGKRCKFKLKMDHRKSYFAFKLTSLHHQFFLKLRSELTSLQGLATDFGVPLTVEPNSPPPKAKPDSGKTKISIASTVKKQLNTKYPMQLEEYQNKENENPQKESTSKPKTPVPAEPVCYTPEEDALYAQVHTRLEPEGESRDTEDESERGSTIRKELMMRENLESRDDKLYSYPDLGIERESGVIYSLPKPASSNDLDTLAKKPEDLYAAINKSGLPKKTDFPIPVEVWDVTDAKKALDKVKTSSLPNYGTARQASGFRTPSLPRRLGVKMGTRAIYSSLAQRDSTLTDDMESLSLKSDTASSIQSTSAQSTESPMPEAYVLNADIRTDDETFHVPADETMSASLAARLEEMSFAEERILHTIKLERGHGGSIGLQVMEGNDGGVYVQAVSVGGSADMAGNVNKGDRIVAISGQSLLNLRYEEALKMLQNSSETVELVLSQVTPNQRSHTKQLQCQETIENNYLQNIKFDVTSETDSSSVTNKWVTQKTPDVSSVQTTSSAYSSAPSSVMGNHKSNSLYLTEVAEINNLASASILLSIEDFDLSRTSRQVFI